MVHELAGVLGRAGDARADRDPSTGFPGRFAWPGRGAGARVGAAGVALALVCSGCSSSGPGLASTSRQVVTWQQCDGDGVPARVECATLQVPLDYRDPGGSAISIALYRRPATTESRGVLVVAPGGPGQSGTAVVDQMTAVEALSWDVVSYDARGVGASGGVHCLTTDTEELPTVAPADIIAAHYTERVRRECSDEPLIRHMETTSVARDLEALRQALGQDRLNAYGLSYGTRVLATYAALFPQHTGRMVLDGVVEPSLQPASPAVELDKAAAAERQLRRFVVSCGDDKSSCAFTGPLDERMASLASLVAGLATHPLATQDGRFVTDREARSAIAVALQEEDQWLNLQFALQSARHGDGTALLSIAEPSRTEDDPNSGLPYWSVDCLDQKAAGPATMSEAELLRRLEAASPVQGAFFLDGFAVCGRWPFEPSEPLPLVARATGNSALVVVGTTGDTAAPFSWAASMAEALPDARLVIVEASSHTALGRSNCLDQIVVSYFDRGEVPARGTHC
jgi:pimeloyl-ACP methyl ester carboxylesterase